MTKLTIIELRQEFDKSLHRIPKFITSTDTLHHALWQAMLECNALLLNLVVDKVLTEKQLDKIIEKFNKYIQIIIDNISESLQINISAYYAIVLEKLLMRSQDEEHYEVCSNLKRFIDYYFTNTTTKDND